MRCGLTKTNFGAKTIEIHRPFFKKHIANLKDNPYIYPEYPENTDYRRMFVSNYIVFYKVNDAEKQIDIYRILRASWDLPKYL